MSESEENKYSVFQHGKYWYVAVPTTACAPFEKQRDAELCCQNLNNGLIKEGEIFFTSFHDPAVPLISLIAVDMYERHVPAGMRVQDLYDVMLEKCKVYESYGLEMPMIEPDKLLEMMSNDRFSLSELPVAISGIYVEQALDQFRDNATFMVGVAMAPIKKASFLKRMEQSACDTSDQD